MTAPTTRERAGQLPSAYPFLLAATVVVTLWLDAAVSPYAVVRSLVVAIILAASITLIAGLLLRSMQLGGLVASGVIGLLSRTGRSSTSWPRPRPGWARWRSSGTR